MEDFEEKFPQKNVTVLHRYDTDFCSDSVEWCPHDPYKSFFVCANYQLEEDKSNGTSDKPRKRLGRILLFSINATTGLTLHQTLDTAAIFDQKWCHKTLSNAPILATVDASGSLTLHQLVSSKLENLTCYKFEEQPETLLLSLDWSTGKFEDNPEIVCSDSQGNVHVFGFSDGTLSLRCSLKGHDYEAWIAAFYYWNTNVIFSGGDDSKFLMFDRRVGEDPVRKDRSYNAGVTCIHSNPFREHVLATGSYDPYLKLWDVRNLKSSMRELEMPGTMWRLKFDPFGGNYLLSACMLGGVHVIDCKTLQIVESFYEHKNIAYGADWSHFEEEMVGSFEGVGNYIIGSCSFYDHLLCVSKILVCE